VSRILLATASADLEARVREATSGHFLSVPLGPLPTSPAALFAHLANAEPPEVVVLDSGSNTEPALELAARFDVQCPGISVVLVSDLGVEIGIDAMRAGVRDILNPSDEPAVMRELLERVYAATKVRTVEPGAAAGVAQATTKGRIITVVSAKGGVGKTTVATNLAVGLAKTARNSTVLVDLDIQFGDVGSALNLDAEYYLPDMVHGPASRDPMVLKTFLSLHETGLHVICGPKRPADADSVTPDGVSQLLQVLADEFTYVVVDTAPGLSEHVLAALDETSDLVLVTSMDVPGVRGLRKELDALTQLHLLPASRHMVLNFADARGGLTLSDVEATLGTPIDVLVPRSRTALESVNRGVPLLQSGARDQVTKQLQTLVDRVAPNASAPAVRRQERRDRTLAKQAHAATAEKRGLRGRFGLRGAASS
jgi:pilus assembly protein CpaE